MAAGVILALPHCGNWEAAGVWLLDHGTRLARWPSG